MVTEQESVLMAWKDEKTGETGTFPHTMENVSVAEMLRRNGLDPARNLNVWIVRDSDEYRIQSCNACR